MASHMMVASKGTSRLLIKCALFHIAVDLPDTGNCLTRVDILLSLVLMLESFENQS